MDLPPVAQTTAVTQAMSSHESDWVTGLFAWDDPIDFGIVAWPGSGEVEGYALAMTMNGERVAFRRSYIGPPSDGKFGLVRVVPTFETGQTSVCIGQEVVCDSPIDRIAEEDMFVELNDAVCLLQHAPVHGPGAGSAIALGVASDEHVRGAGGAKVTREYRGRTVLCESFEIAWGEVIHSGIGREGFPVHTDIGIAHGASAVPADIAVTHAGHLRKRRCLERDLKLIGSAVTRSCDEGGHGSGESGAIALMNGRPDIRKMWREKSYVLHSDRRKTKDDSTDYYHFSGA